MKSKSILFSTTIFFTFLISINLSAQIKVSTDNNVGVGVENPLSKFSVNTEGLSNYTSSFYSTGENRAGIFTVDYPTNSNYNIALVGKVTNYSTGQKNVAGYFNAYQTTAHSKKTFGVRGSAGNGLSGYNYGVMGLILGAGNGAGIVGIDGGELSVPGKFAGYFYGDVRVDNGILYVNSTQYTSDIRLKRNIISLKTEDNTLTSVNKLSSLTAIKYQLIDPRTVIADIKSDTSSFNITTKEQEFLDRQHIGLSAQEVQKVFPELVSSDQQGFLSVDYVGLIPVLIEGMKEQQDLIETLQQNLLLLQKELDMLKQD